MALHVPLTVTSAARNAFLAAAIMLWPVTMAQAANKELNRYVEADSRFGHGSINGLVRDTGNGPQVQLPGGTWVYCRRSCSETLRVETLDFFESNAAGSAQLTNECGIFGCLDLGFSR